MLEVQICLVAVRALILAISILVGIGWRFSSSWSGPPRMSGQNATATLLADNVYWLRFLVRKHRRVRIELRVGCHTHASHAHVLQSIRHRRRG
jgi:hypothetical protein